ncbi:phiSA1p31-related protein [Streptomyces fulvorobeus]|uniref:Uncharacterized protein n=1 Tax=Streptomyces fulvorobeus TaxID=284028 RepID=A0A7J0CE02_9ACTN|nr:phiSA1p31-related protein [Streptomyces fulvorobeus]NYE44235.1 hypothetical protein [Streptomyces fulvorobeus]GFN00751.1 hypothetical protein Sfulv_55610 [Streptomyces fulvorobeus]
MTEFKVGDKVRHTWLEAVEVTYGPYTDMRGQTRYMVRVASGGEQPTTPEMMVATPAFSVGDKARRNGHTVEILAGPVEGAVTGAEIYLFKYLDGPDVGKGGGRNASEFEALPTTTYTSPAGITYDLAGEYTDRLGYTWSFTGRHSPDGTPCVTAYGNANNTDTIDGIEDSFGPLCKVTAKPADGFEYEGVVYEYDAEYTDCDGDNWTFYRSTRTGGAPLSTYSSYRSRETLQYVVDNYGPLTK